MLKQDSPLIGLLLTLVLISAALPKIAYAMLCDRNNMYRSIPLADKRELSKNLKKEKAKNPKVTFYVIYAKDKDLQFVSVDASKSAHTSLPAELLNRKQNEIVFAYYPPGQHGYILPAGEPVSGPACLEAQKNDRFLRKNDDGSGCEVVNLRNLDSATMITGAEVGMCTEKARIEKNQKQSTMVHREVNSQRFHFDPHEKRLHDTPPSGTLDKNTKGMQSGSDKHK